MLAHAHNPYVFTFFFLSLFLHFCCVEFACLFTNFTFNKRWHHFLWNKISAPKIEKAAAKHITVIWTQKKNKVNHQQRAPKLYEIEKSTNGVRNMLNNILTS